MARLSSLRIELLPDGRSARLLTPYRVHTEDGVSVDVPEGFVTDFASVPRFFWRILPPWSWYYPAVVVHDYLYFSGECSRADADRTMRRLMRQLIELAEASAKGWRDKWEVLKRKIQTSAMYRAVRAFGWMAWNRHRKKGLGAKPKKR